jgi:hypothetical protein
LEREVKWDILAAAKSKIVQQIRNEEAKPQERSERDRELLRLILAAIERDMKELGFQDELKLVAGD